MLSYIISGLVLAHLQDRFGRRPIIWGSMSIEFLGILGCFFSVNMYQYIISRFFVGLGGSGREAVAVISENQQMTNSLISHLFFSN